jgi:hypothetical protein
MAATVAAKEQRQHPTAGALPGSQRIKELANPQ